MCKRTHLKNVSECNSAVDDGRVFHVISCFDGRNYCFWVANGENWTKTIKCKLFRSARFVCHLTPLNEHEKYLWIIDMFVMCRLFAYFIYSVLVVYLRNEFPLSSKKPDDTFAIFFIWQFPLSPFRTWAAIEQLLWRRTTTKAKGVNEKLRWHEMNKFLIESKH